MLTILMGAPALACVATLKLNPNAESHLMFFPDKSVRFASNRMEFSEDDILFIQLPDNARANTSNGDATLNRILDLNILESEQFKKIAPPDLVSAAMAARLSRRKGHTWWAFQARPGNTLLTIDIGGNKTALNVTVKRYIPPAAEPVQVTLENATREKPFGMEAGQEFEVSVPGDLAAGWSVDGLKESGVTLKSLTSAKPVGGAAGSSPPMIRLRFEVARSAYASEPLRISIKHGGAISGETFDAYLVFYSIPAC